MGAVQLQSEDLERRVREYKNDTFIQGCINQIAKIAALAKPYIKVSLSGNIEDSVFDIDEKSRQQIQWYKNRIEEYKKINYPEFYRNE